MFNMIASVAFCVAVFAAGANIVIRSIDASLLSKEDLNLYRLMRGASYLLTFVAAATGISALILRWGFGG